MTYRTVLTVTGLDLGDGDVELAAAVCSESDAHLSVLVVALAAPPPIGEYAAMVSDPWLQERQSDLDRLEQRTSAVSALLASREISSDVVSDYPEEAWGDDVIGRRARYADIVLLGPEMLSGGALKDKAIEGVLFSSGKPMLLVPRGFTPSLRPKRVAIAWDSRLESSNALSSSLKLLRTAEDVHLVLVDPREGEEGHGAEPGADAATYLARHGIKVTVDRLPSQGRTVAATLRQHAIDMAADLLVMGAYGHSRLRQRIFGGVTKSMLEELPLPVLMAR
ncbi:universal stress protein [Arvimicrobium flavum]|uniref:universal stress protein n=1 Tax=Arvimicrobium flavum TaxID=3393320 RepID=UPI00237B0C70|nr:universal stress protein [Mesorhizobium shangrilense]